MKISITYGTIITDWPAVSRELTQNKSSFTHAIKNSVSVTALKMPKEGTGTRLKTL
jgi:hypothetical protein